MISSDQPEVLSLTIQSPDCSSSTRPTASFLESALEVDDDHSLFELMSVFKNSQERRVALLFLAGFTEEQIGKLLNLTRSKVWRIKQKIRNRLLLCV